MVTGRKCNVLLYNASQPVVQYLCVGVSSLLCRRVWRAKGAVSRQLFPNVVRHRFCFTVFYDIFPPITILISTLFESMARNDKRDFLFCFFNSVVFSGQIKYLS